MVVDYWRTKPALVPVAVEGDKVEVVTTKYLGIHLDSTLDWSANTDAVYKKGQSLGGCGPSMSAASSSECFTRLPLPVYSFMLLCVGEAALTRGTVGGWTGWLGKLALLFAWSWRASYQQQRKEHQTGCWKSWTWTDTHYTTLLTNRRASTVTDFCHWQATDRVKKSLVLRAIMLFSATQKGKRELDFSA